MKDFEIKVTSKLWSEKWNSIVTWVDRHYLRVFLKSSFSFLWFLWNTWLHLGEQGWRSTGESVRLPPMWPGLDCYARHPNQQCLLYGKIRWNINPLTFCIVSFHVRKWIVWRRAKGGACACSANSRKFLAKRSWERSMTKIVRTRRGPFSQVCHINVMPYLLTDDLKSIKE